MVFSTTSFYPQDAFSRKETPKLPTDYAKLIQKKALCVWIIGLTGAIGAGKSKISSYFQQQGIPVHCADTYVHFLFEHDREVQRYIHSLWPEVVFHGKIDRLLLGNRVFSSPKDLKQLEDFLYPKLAEDQRKFLQKKQYLKVPIVVLDVPLLFEVGLASYCDYVIVVATSPSLRKNRVMKRKGMTVKKFHTLDRLQIEESERRKKADFIIYTGLDKGHALKTVQQILFVLSQRPPPKWQGKWPKNFKREAQ